MRMFVRKMVIPFSGTFPLRIIRDIIAILISLAIRLEWSMWPTLRA